MTDLFVRKITARDFHSPMALWGVFEEYQTWCKANPIKSKTRKNIETTIEAPLTVQGFCRFSGISRSTFTKWRAGQHVPEGLADTIEAISATIDEHLLSRALVEVYLENLVARMTGQSDKFDQNITQTETVEPVFLERLTHPQLVMLRALQVAITGANEKPDQAAIIEAAQNIIAGAG